MREADFRAWLDKRLWKGNPLTKKARDNRVRRTLRAERGLKGLGFAYDSLDALFADGQWSVLLDRLGQLRNDPAPDLRALRSVVPQADNPTGQLNNMIAALRHYAHFLEGRDPNYGAIEAPDDGDDVLDLTVESVEEAMQAYDADPAGWMAKYPHHAGLGRSPLAKQFTITGGLERLSLASVDLSGGDAAVMAQLACLLMVRVALPA